MNVIDQAPSSLLPDRSALRAHYGAEEKTTEGVAP
jgi:hypothetical protein